MEQIKKSKFTLEKFEVAKLKNTKNIIGGSGVGGDPDTVTKTSSNCSFDPTCKDKTPDDDIPMRPMRPIGPSN
jgi:hypothetical protein